MRGRDEPIGPIGWLRVVGRIAGMLALLPVCALAYYLAQPLTRHNPWPRRFLAGVARLSGIVISTQGKRCGPGEFFLCNHVSWMDIPVLAATSGAAFIAHDGLTRFTLLRLLCEMNDTVFVARHDRRSVGFQIEQVRAALRDTGTLALFPEGTTSDGTGVLAFKSSLLSALDRAPEVTTIQPVLLDYGPQAPEIAWVGDDPGPANFVRILARSKPVPVTVVFLPPLSGEEMRDRKAIARAAREALVAEIGRRR